MSCESATVRVPELEAEFGRHDLPSNLTVGDECESAIASLRAASYSTADKMHIMRLASPTFATRKYVEVFPARPADHAEWVSVYLGSFYGSDELGREVRDVLQSLPPGETELLIAKLGGSSAGALACQRSPGLMGVYCVGTLPRFRRQGVAATLLQRAAGLARDEGRDLILQTLDSDSAVDFYRGQGFEESYAKRLMVKERLSRRPRRSGAG